MAQESLDNHYNQRIQYLQVCGRQLLESIKSLEIGMNRRHQQNEQVHPDDLNRMYSMTKNFFQLLAEIKNCQYLKTTHKLVNFNEEFYITTCDVFFKNHIRQFNAEFKTNVFYKELVQRFNAEFNTNNEIDFSINS